jgi:hypothetical protein
MSTTEPPPPVYLPQVSTRLGEQIRGGTLGWVLLHGARNLPPTAVGRDMG